VAYHRLMVRHKRIVVATVAAMAGFLSGTLAPAAGDQRATGSSAKATSYDTGPECKAGFSKHKADRADPSDY
jgi:hypothetical protein